MAEGSAVAEDPSADAAYGSLLGACVGDAAGAVLEFMYKLPTATELDYALSMKGGGVWIVGPGQVTDDSELAMCLAQALKDHPASGPVPLDDIAMWYGKWLSSPPFDIGHTTRLALSAARECPDKEGLGRRMQQKAAQHNQQSLSNGCLMRITPIAIWSHKLGVDHIAAAAAADASLTHPNKIAQLACGSYCIAIAHLINNPRDAAGAIEAARQWLQRGLAQQADSSTATELNSSQIASSGSCSSRGCEPHGAQASDLAKADAVCWKTVLSWLTDATVQASGPGPAVHEQAGFLKWGFVHAFRALQLKLSFEASLRHILSLGGDTDTNAAIVGGLMGAYWGAAAIPADMAEAVVSRTVDSPGRQRPEFLQTKQLPELFAGLYAAAGH